MSNIIGCMYLAMLKTLKPNHAGCVKMSALCVSDMAKKGPSQMPIFSLISDDPLRQKLHDARNSLTDFTIKVEDTEISCHKWFLSVQSEYFKRMLSHEETKEVVEGAVTFDYLNPNAVQVVVEFFYSGTMEFQFDFAKEVIEVVNYFQVTDNRLIKKLSAFIKKNLTLENCLGWLTVSDQLNMPKVKEKASDIMLRNFSAVANVPEFVNLECKQFSDIMGLAVQHNTDQDQALEAAVRWTMHDVDTRKDTFEEVIKGIKLRNCSPNVLLAIYEKYGKVLITNADVQQQFTMEALSLAHAAEQPCDVLVIGGRLSTDKVNKQTWVINLKTGIYGQRASIPEKKNMRPPFVKLQ